MAPHRFAIVVVLICVGVMLLSACGLGLGNSRYVPPPIVVTQDVMLVAPADGARPATILGFAVLGGTSMQDLGATLAFAQPVCGVRRFDLRGSTSIFRPEWVSLRGGATDGSSIEISATMARVTKELTADLFPFRASMNLTTKCSGNTLREVEVRRTPDLTGTWVGVATQTGGRPIPVSVALNFSSNIYAGSWVSGEITAENSPCFVHGTHAQQGDQVGVGPFTLHFKTATGTGVELRSTNSPLLTDAARNGMEEEMTVRGGICDGQVFHLLLRRQ